jgi:lantibiotic modifying enzyme
VCSNDTIPDEILVGKAGFLSGIYWLNQQITPKPFSPEDIQQVCQRITKTGREYSKRHHSPFPLMYDYHDSEYLGAAHGISGILLMLQLAPKITKVEFDELTASIEGFLAMQDSEGNFPTRLTNSDKKLVHWCHGASGIIYLAAKFYLVNNDEKYLRICEKCADLVWHKGLLRKGPGICHGIAGNGYVHLLMYRLTLNSKYLYRAFKFAEFLKSDEFIEHARTPDRPFSLYEGLAGTVCFLLDLLEPERSAFPFMNIFDSRD